MTLVIGGARSGKSRYAQAEAARFERVTFIATARASDREMRQKIAAHRRERPRTWKTVEARRALDEVIRREASKADVLLLDCLTTYCGGMLGQIKTGAGRRKHLDALVDAFRSASASMVIVTNEVGSGVVPAFKSGRVFRDLLGMMNQQVAAVADRVVLLIAGIPVAVKGRL